MSKLYTNPKYYHSVKQTKLLKHFKRLATGRFCKRSVAQMLLQGEFCTSYKHATLVCFCLQPSELTEEEQSATKLVYDMSQGNLMARFTRMLLADSRSANSMKVIAEMKGMINNLADDADERNRTLNINFTTDGKKEEDEAPTVTNKERKPPLRLAV